MAGKATGIANCAALRVEASATLWQTLARPAGYLMSQKAEGFVFDEDELRELAAKRLRTQRPAVAATATSTAASEAAGLPIAAYEQDLVEAIKSNQILLVIGETGSGKTTQLPQYLHRARFTSHGLKIGCTQPRRVAAMSVAARVSEEMSERLGGLVGYSIRFEERTSSKTLIKYMTDGMLLREFLLQPDLSEYAVMIIDEAHERTLNTDILFALLKDVAKLRPDFKLVISSATLDAEKFSDYFDGAPVFRIPGRRFPVKICYTQQPESDYLDATIRAIMQIHMTEPAGDILAFLTGQDEIETAAEILGQRAIEYGKQIGEMKITQIYSTMPSELQAAIFKPTPQGARKIVLATNIAETSITIDGIVYVVDSGFAKQKSFNPRTGMESLVVTPISKASADQRAGRAGRVQAGTCYRLYTQLAFEDEMEASSIPEIQRTNLGNVVLLLKSIGIDDAVHFDFMDPPPLETILCSLELLYKLGALNEKNALTRIGRKMSEFPLEPTMSRSLLAAEQHGCTEEVLTIISLLSLQSGSIYVRPKEKSLNAAIAHKQLAVPDGDHMTLLNIFNQHWSHNSFVQQRALLQAKSIRAQLSSMLRKTGVSIASTSDPTAIKKSLLAGYLLNIATLSSEGDSYQLVFGNREKVYIHPGSVLNESRPRCVFYSELVLTSKEYIRVVSEIEPSWIAGIAP